MRKGTLVGFSSNTRRLCVRTVLSKNTAWMPALSRRRIKIACNSKPRSRSAHHTWQCEGPTELSVPPCGSKGNACMCDLCSRSS